eukprot:TRINITY_DN2392_c0_g1_i12.p1 TRINITY_DN2392_c0_g1~~TRINITY_DN2392_c0_g1_i12.p1  ORF type:complete len:345 (-),score=122.98 TRINITY_DN2392_c0_g1_i12:420-1454(-)
MNSECKLFLRVLQNPSYQRRGRYATDLYKNFLRFHGSTFGYKINYKNFKHAFILPRPDDVHMMFVIGLDKPVRQGQTSYPYIIMQFKKDIEETVKIKLRPEQIKEMYGEDMKEEYTGPLYETVSKIFKLLVGINVVVPSGFKSSQNHASVRCSVRANEGLLFPLPKAVLFINKPVMYIKIDDLSRAEFHRIGSGIQNKLFDLELIMKNQNTTTFVGIDKKELNLLVEYFQQRKVPVKQVDDSNTKIDYEESEDDDDDDDDSVKANRRRTKPSGVKTALPPNFKDDDDEEDEDFVASEDDESDEEDDEDEDEDFEEEEDEKKKKKASAKPAGSDKKPKDKQISQR